MTKPILPLLTMQQVHRLFGANILAKPASNPATITADTSFSLIEVAGNQKESVVFRAEYNALILCKSGTCDKEIGIHTFKMKPKSIHFVKAGELQIFTNQTPDVNCLILCFYTKIWSDFPGFNTIFEQLLNLADDQVPYFDLEENAFNQIFDLYQKIDKEQKLHAPLYTSIIALTVMEILYLVKRSSLPIFEKEHQQRIPAQRRKWLLFKQMVEEHFQTNKSVKEYAKLLHITPKYLNEIVNKETGSSPIKHIQRRIISEAKYLLAFTDLSIKEITYLLQFESPVYFGKFFRSKTGDSPSTFRKKRA